MEYKAWEFEGDWYISINNAFPLCMNTEAACLEFAKAQAKMRQIAGMCGHPDAAEACRLIVDFCKDEMDNINGIA